MNKINRSIKNKNMKKDLLLQKMFNLDYAGKAHIFIQFRKDKYILTAYGIHFVDNIFMFAPNYKKSWSFDSLYDSILGFNIILRQLASNTDWYSPELFTTNKVYEELFIKD